jgi:capsid protein
MLLDQFGKPLPARSPRPRSGHLAASYDAAATNRGNSKHWAAADALGPLNANRRAVREKLRRRARYEALESNSYAVGIVQTLANDTIGEGPVLALHTGNRDTDRNLERDFLAWANAVGLAKKLRAMRLAKAVDGECFAKLVNNERLTTPSKLDFLPLECDLITDPDTWLADTADNADGIFLDQLGYPARYRILQQHPGDAITGRGLGYDDLPADQVLHLFHGSRPGQQRGIPEITPALPLFALLRAFTLATLNAAETAANHAGVMKTTSANVDPNVDDDNDFMAIDTERNSLLVLPAGWEMQQLKAEHPTTTYTMFKAEIINEIARCLSMPYNVAAGNSSNYNYASGRLDHQTYYRALRVERKNWESVILDRLFAAWLAEHLAASTGISPVDIPVGNFPHAWLWAEAEHVDPLKEANAADVELANGSLTLAEVCARRRIDWEAHLEQVGREMEIKRRIGLLPPLPEPVAQPGSRGRAAANVPEI